MTDYTVVIQQGRPYRVPTVHAKKFVKKNQLVTEVMSLKGAKSQTLTIAEQADIDRRISELVGKIIRLNRRIPPCAIPVT